MALFSSSRAILGLDIGTASLKVVELLDRHKRLEVATYAQANLINELLDPKADEATTVNHFAQVIAQMLDKAGVSTDSVVAALPSSIVFSTVLNLPSVPEAEMEKAVRAAAREVVPASLDEMVLGWSRVGEPPHLKTDKPQLAETTSPSAQATSAMPTPLVSTNTANLMPVFITAAPKVIVDRYLHLIELLQLELVALEVETFSLVRSLLEPQDSALIVDIGDQVTTFHLIDTGTARVSYTSEIGGHDITAALAEGLHVPETQAEATKVQAGLVETGNTQVHQLVESVTQKLINEAKQVLQMYVQQANRSVSKTVLIGGGANLRGLVGVWEKGLGIKTVVGNPWQGLAYPQELSNRLTELGPTYAVAVGLARRGFSRV